jgi:hypothetical protein
MAIPNPFFTLGSLATDAPDKSIVPNDFVVMKLLPVISGCLS